MTQPHVVVTYIFTHCRGEIYELKFCNLADNAPLEDRYQWYLNYLGTRYKLKFINYKGDIRIFKAKKFFNSAIELDIDNMMLYITKEGDPYGKLYHTLSKSI
jgi:hypothetical protein